MANIMEASSEWGECGIKLQNLIKEAIKVICLTKSLVMNNSFCILMSLKCLKLDIILVFNHEFKLLHIQTVPAFYSIPWIYAWDLFSAHNVSSIKIYRVLSFTKIFLLLRCCKLTQTEICRALLSYLHFLVYIYIYIYIYITIIIT